nr:hypothetical protein [Tanacetum cinerariifolium]
MSISLEMKMTRQRIQSLDILGHSRVAAWSKKKGRFLAEMVILFFERNIPAATLTPDDNEFVEQKIELERNRKDVDDIKEQMLKFKEEMNARSMRQENTEPINVGQHYGFSDFSQIQSMHVPSHIGRPNLQTTIETQHDFDGLVDQNILNRGKKQQLPSKYLVTSFTTQPPTTMVPKQRISKNKNKGKKANLSPVNLGGVLEGYNEEDNNVTFWVLNLLTFIWHTNWLVGGEHMNSWIELMIRRRPLNANWTVAYTSTISVHLENNQFIILRDPHVIGTLDGSTHPYPS